MPKYPSEPVLGIDLGSANSACAIYMNGVPIPIPNEIGVKQHLLLFHLEVLIKKIK